jgi:ML domain
VTIEPAQPIVGENITVTVKGQILKRVTAGQINVDLRLMKFIKLTPTFDLCEQLDGDLFSESNASCPLEEGPVTLIAKKLIPEDVPKVSVQGNITLTNQDGETLTCMHPFSRIS